MDKSEQTIELFGSKIPRWQDCNRCKTKLACHFSGFTYSQPCDKCRDTKEWEEEQAIYQPQRSMEDMMNIQQATSVFTMTDKRGRPIRNLKINHKGNIISDEPYKPLGEHRIPNKK